MDDAGCEVIDRDALFQLLSLVRKTLVSQGQITIQPQSQQIETEVKYILESCVAVTTPTSANTGVGQSPSTKAL